MRKLLKQQGEAWKLVPKSKFKAGEKGLQSLVERNMDMLLSTKFVGSEKQMSKLGRIDSVGIKDGQLVLIEYKEDDGKRNEFAKHIMNQGIHYIVSAINNFDEFEEYVRYQAGQILDPLKVPKIILVAKDFHTFDKSMLEAFNHQQVVKLKEYELFEDDCLYFYLADTVTQRGFREDKFPSYSVDLNKILRSDNDFDRYLIEHPEEALEFLSRVFTQLYGHIEEPSESSFIKVNSDKTTLLEREDLDDNENMREIIEANINNIFNATYIGSDLETPITDIGNIDTLCIDQDGRLIIVDYNLGDGRFVSEALLKASWASRNHSAVQAFVLNGLERELMINWGYDIDLVMVGTSFTDREKHLCDLNCEGIRPRLMRLETYKAGKERLALFNHEVTKRDLETYVGSIPAYGMDDYLSRLSTENAKNALRYILGELRDLDDELILVQNKYGYGVKANHVFCQLRIGKGDSFNVKVKVGDDFDDRHDLCSGKTGDGYARINIKGDDLDTIKYTLGYIRYAFNQDTGRKLKSRRKK